jgi:triphosphatase
VLQDYRLAMCENARETLRQEQWSRLLLSLTLWPHMLESGGGKLDKPVEKIAGKAIAKSWRKASKYGRRIASLDPGERHEMRKSLKRLRYTIEFFLPLYEQDEARQFVKRLKDLQDIFGYINDVRMAAHLKTICVPHAVQVASACEAAGYVLGRHEAEVPHVWKNAGHEWHRIASGPHFWH